MDILIKIEGEQCHGLFVIKMLLKKIILIQPITSGANRKRSRYNYQILWLIDFPSIDNGSVKAPQGFYTNKKSRQLLNWTAT